MLPTLTDKGGVGIIPIMQVCGYGEVWVGVGGCVGRCVWVGVGVGRGVVVCVGGCRCGYVSWC